MILVGFVSTGHNSVKSRFLYKGHRCSITVYFISVMINNVWILDDVISYVLKKDIHFDELWHFQKFQM